MHLYVGSRTTRERDARGLGLSVYDVNDGLDRWQRLQVIEAVNPSFLALSEDGRMLYAVHGDQTSVSSYAVELDGRLQFLNRRSAGGRNPVHLHLSADGRRLLVASYANGLLSCLPVLADGSLAEIASTLAFEGEPGPHRVEQRGSHPHQVLRLSETDLYVVPDKGLDRVHLVRLASDGALHLVQSAVMRSGSGPRHAVFDRGRAALWVANELDSTLTTFTVDIQQGALRPRHVTSVLPGKYTGENRSAGIAANCTTRTLYVSNRGHDSICVLRIGQDGTTQPLQWVSSLGRTPRFLTVADDGRHLIVANEATDSLVTFSIADDGSLKEGRIVEQTGSPVCVVQQKSHGKV